LSEDEKMQAGLCYPLWFFFSPWILSSGKKKELFLYFHALQGLLFGVLTSLTTIVTGIFVYLLFFKYTSKVVPPTGTVVDPKFMADKMNFAMFSIFALVVFAIAVLGIFCISIWLGFKATSGKMFKIPVIGVMVYEKVEKLRIALDEQYPDIFAKPDKTSEYDGFTSIEDPKTKTYPHQILPPTPGANALNAASVTSAEDMLNRLNPTIGHLKSLFSEPSNENEDDEQITPKYKEQERPVIAQTPQNKQDIWEMVLPEAEETISPENIGTSGKRIEDTVKKPIEAVPVQKSSIEKPPLGSKFLNRGPSSKSPVAETFESITVEKSPLGKKFGDSRFKKAPSQMDSLESPFSQNSLIPDEEQLDRLRRKFEELQTQEKFSKSSYGSGELDSPDDNISPEQHLALLRKRFSDRTNEHEAEALNFVIPLPDDDESRYKSKPTNVLAPNEHLEYLKSKFDLHKNKPSSDKSKNDISNENEKQKDSGILDPFDRGEQLELMYRKFEERQKSYDSGVIRLAVQPGRFTENQLDRDAVSKEDKSESEGYNDYEKILEEEILQDSASTEQELDRQYHLKNKRDELSQKHKVVNKIDLVKRTSQAGNDDDLSIPNTKVFSQEERIKQMKRNLEDFNKVPHNFRKASLSPANRTPISKAPAEVKETKQSPIIKMQSEHKSPGDSNTGGAKPFSGKPANQPISMTSFHSKPILKEQRKDDYAEGSIPPGEQVMKQQDTPQASQLETSRREASRLNLRISKPPELPGKVHSSQQPRKPFENIEVIPKQDTVKSQTSGSDKFTKDKADDQGAPGNLPVSSSAKQQDKKDAPGFPNPRSIIRPAIKPKTIAKPDFKPKPTNFLPNVPKQEDGKKS
jgi:uncharacterized membrane protein